ncbi:MAG: helicase-related protein [bacterium]|nr:helicase-related protein [bacterium]
MNPSKKGDKRFWDLWHKNDAVQSRRLKRPVVPNHRKWWGKFRYPGIPENIVRDRRYDWERVAENIRSLLADASVALVADASAGKTIIAILIALSRPGRTIFCVPLVHLTKQQRFVVERIGVTVPTRAVSGLVPTGKRAWRKWKERIIFATPDVVRNDVQSGALTLDPSTLVILDELDVARGKYPYVELAQLCTRAGVRVLGLTATLDSRRYPRDRQLLRDCCIPHEVREHFKVPNLTESSVVLPLTKELSECERLLKDMIVETAKQLNECHIRFDPNQILTIKEWRDLWKRHLKSDKEQIRWDEKVSLLARYSKLRHSYVTVLAEGYESLTRYAEDTLEKQDTVTARRVLIDGRFRKVLSIARRNHRHPKFQWLLKVAESHARMHRPMLVFVGQRATAVYLAEQLTLRGLPSAAVWGGRKTKRAERELDETLRKLAAGELVVLVSTSFAERGWNLPDVRSVVHYSLPQTWQSRHHRNRRAGRILSGAAFLVSVDHHMDMLWLWTTKVLAERLEPPATVQWLLGTPPRKGERPRRRKQRDTVTLPLFEEYA